LCSIDQVKGNETGAARGTSGGDDSPYRVLVGTSEGKRPPGRPTRRWEWTGIISITLETSDGLF
jgi:hypothetical protein